MKHEDVRRNKQTCNTHYQSFENTIEIYLHANWYSLDRYWTAIILDSYDDYSNWTCNREENGHDDSKKLERILHLIELLLLRNFGGICAWIEQVWIQYQVNTQETSDNRQYFPDAYLLFYDLLRKKWSKKYGKPWKWHGLRHRHQLNPNRKKDAWNEIKGAP